MTLDEFIACEVTLARTSKLRGGPNARFVELHLQSRRNADEAAEYLVLYSAMRTRWRWYRASLDANRLRKYASY